MSGHESGADHSSLTQSGKPSKLSLISLNARSIVNKLRDFEVEVLDRFDFPSIICITETWLTPAVPDSFLPCKYYHVFRRDREDRPGGGVCIMVRKDINCHIFDLGDGKNAEFLCVKIRHGSKRFAVCVAYRHSVTDINALPIYRSIIKAAAELRMPVLVTGDFNLPDVCWKTHQAPARYKQDEFCLMFTEFGFRQLVVSPTRHEATLDLVFCNDESLVLDVGVDQPLSTSDHNIVICSLNVQSLCSVADVRYDWSRADFLGLSACIELICWNQLFDGRDVNQMWEIFKKLCKLLFQYFVPFRRARAAAPSMPKKRYPRYVVRLLRKKRLLFRKRRSHGSARKTYMSVARKCKEAISSWNLQTETEILRCRSNKRFFSYINGRLGSRPAVPDVKDNGEIVSGDRAKCEVFNSHYSSVFVHDDGCPLNVLTSLA